MFTEVQKIARPYRGAIIDRNHPHCFQIPAVLRRGFAVSLMVVAGAALLGAQDAVRSIGPAADYVAEASPLNTLVSRSEIIFAGNVASIQQSPVHNWKAVRFNVEAGVRGVEGRLFEANFIESTPGTFPLRPGERVVVFLHARNEAGITSFVANGCGLFPRTGADRVALERLKLCPVLHHSSLAPFREPAVVWPDPRNFLTGKPTNLSFSPIAGKTSRPEAPVSISSDGSIDMSTADFLMLISALANGRQIGNGVHPETRSVSDPSLSGLH